MNIRKSILKVILLSILFNNIHFCSNANALNNSNLNRYQIIQDRAIMLENIKPENLTEIEIFGNTIQNPNNLKDIQSVGDLYIDEEGSPILDNQGRKQYKIVIENSADNLLDINNLNIRKNHDSITTNVKNKSLIIHSSHVNVIRYEIILPIHKLQYNVNYHVGFTLLEDNLQKNTIYTELRINGVKKFQSGNKISHSFSIDKNTEEVSLFIEHKDDFSWKEYGITIGDLFLSSTNTYKDYINPSKTTILLPQQLLKVDDIADKLYWDNNKKRYIIEKHIAEIIYPNYQKQWMDFSINNDRVCIASNGGNFSNSFGKVISFSNKKILSFESSPGTSTGSHIYLYFNKEFLLDKGYEFSYSGARQYLIESDATMYLPLYTPDIIEIDITKPLHTTVYNNYKDKAHIYTETENKVNPTLKITIDRIEEVSGEAVENVTYKPTSNNIALARMFVNMLPDSLYKDQLQAKLNEIFSEDIILEKQSATANLDVYIKSENILMMSLDTNTVTFEDYSGVEELEIQDAINISINSSLPYSLNAYIVSDIANKDKNKTLDLDVLSIRDVNETIYQKFGSVNSKIILKDNCSKGNNISHNIDLKLSGNNAHDADVYKTTIKFEAEQK